MYMIWIWLAVLAVGLIVELIDAGTLVSVWFSVGAVIPLLMSIWRTNNGWYISAQVIVFGLVTILSLVFLRKLCLKFLYKNNKETTNIDSLTNKRVKVVSLSEDKTHATVKINGVEYTAVFEDDDKTFEPNEEVYIKKFEGNKIIVYRKNKEE